MYLRNLIVQKLIFGRCIKSRIFDEVREKKIMESNEDNINTFIMDNYLQEPHLDKKKILSYILNKLKQERSSI